MTKDQIAATKFVEACKSKGWNYSTRGSIVTIQKSFTPGDKNAYCDCDSEAYSLLSLAPLKGGSIWGTDGGSIGGMIGCDGGYYKLNKSGNGSKRFLKALASL